MTTTYEVYKNDTDGDFYVKGLKSERSGCDQRVLYHIPYPQVETPEVTNPASKEAMHTALYDMYQWHDGLKEHDKFVTPYGKFKCVSFHVVEDK